MKLLGKNILCVDLLGRGKRQNWRRDRLVWDGVGVPSVARCPEIAKAFLSSTLPP